MGYSLPAAIGAQVRPARTRTVWAIAGDGCFQMKLQELAVLRRGAHPGQDRPDQQRLPGHGPPVAAAVLRQATTVHVDLAGTPDYVKLAEAYGIPAWRVDDAGGASRRRSQAARAHPARP